MADSNPPSVIEQAKAANILKPAQIVGVSVTPAPAPVPKPEPKVTITQEYNASGGHKLMVEVEGHSPAYSDWTSYNVLATVKHPATGKLYVGASEYFKGVLPTVFVAQEVKDHKRRRID